MISERRIGLKQQTVIWLVTSVVKKYMFYYTIRYSNPIWIILPSNHIKLDM